jgi:hypothetical protein
LTRKMSRVILLSPTEFKNKQKHFKSILIVSQFFFIVNFILCYSLFYLLFGCQFEGKLQGFKKLRNFISTT